MRTVLHGLYPGLVLAIGIGIGTSALARQGPGWQFDRDVDREALPIVPPGFDISFFAKEPLVRQPCAMAFDGRGRLCVGMGPQYRNPKPETPGDAVVLVLDDDGDGQADRVQTFAGGFNAIQGLAWHGRDLWVANSPDLTVVRDLDGDDVADEYVRIYTDLGNLEHGLHGLNWAPDGKLYMSKGNSKGLTEPGRVAPKPFRELWGVTAPVGTPDFPAPRTFTRDQYRKTYHDPEDDWGREGGVLRCDDGGANLEIVSRGMRNPWDIAFDTGFHWIGTDNDQTTGDRVLMPFIGAHFGWNHPWSAHWGTDAHDPSAPVSGPLFEGSGTGVVFGDSPEFPASHRGVFFINDWLRKTTFVWRPRWEGALMRAAREWEPFVQGGRALFRPTDMEVGPDGALWILGWGSGYGAEYRDGQMTSEGRVFRVVAQNGKLRDWRVPKRTRPLPQWTAEELIDDLEGPLPVWRINAQDELVRRGASVRVELVSRLEKPSPGTGTETWMAWALGRMLPADSTVDAWFVGRLANPSTSLNLRLQAVRILAHRCRGRGPLPEAVVDLLRSPESRLRMEAVTALAVAGKSAQASALLASIAVESDGTVFYASWQALRRLEEPAAVRGQLTDPRSAVRKAALLALLESHALKEGEVRLLASDADPGVKAVAALWLEKAGAGGQKVEMRGRPLDARPGAVAGASTKPGVSVSRGVQARSQHRYAVVPGGLRAGARPYSDRGYILKEVPVRLQGLDFIQTANDDEGARGAGWLRFEALGPVRVHVAFDNRGAAPGWLQKDFRKTGAVLRADHWTFDLYVRDYPVGIVELGGNTDDGKVGGKGNYMVVLEPLPLPAPATPTGIEAALAMLDRGDAGRGEWLFHASSGVGCIQCHLLAGSGNAFGPDLASVGDRASARHLVQSMLEPNAVITEGFQLQTVVTADGEQSGILIEESGLSLTLGLANGERRTIPKAQVMARSTAPTSAMPAYDTLLSSQQAADLVAYLLGQKAVATPKPRDGSTSAFDRDSRGAEPSDLNGGFHWSERSDRLVIALSGHSIGEFVFRDERILRPYLANVRAPDGTRATRSHPPVPGIDAVDHDTMHPGIWLAFGDVSGADFWRNKGRMEHVGFVEPPALREGKLGFATGSRLITPDGRTLCHLTTRLRFHALTNAWRVDWEATFRSDDGDFVFGDQEEMGFGARVATPITEKNGGLVTSSSALRGAARTWGQPALWCDYSGVLEGRSVGLTLVADPGNFRGSWWHNRDYGVFVANPFGRASMKQGEKSAVTVRRGEDFRIRFAAVVHTGDGYRPDEAARGEE